MLWPRARLSLGPKEIVTYPEEAVRATVEFLGVRCPSAKGSPVSESWLELVYCGPVLSDCTYNNYTQRQVSASRVPDSVARGDGKPQVLNMCSQRCCQTRSGE